MEKIISLQNRGLFAKNEQLGYEILVRQVGWLVLKCEFRDLRTDVVVIPSAYA